MGTVIAITNVLLFFVGQYYVTRQHLGGFLVWASSNLMLAVFSINRGDPCIGCLFIIYGFANAHSLMMWSRKSAAHSK